jgi:hypothetical protein
MMVDIQWATDPVSDWITIDAADWIQQPKKPKPPHLRQPVFDVSGDRLISFTGPELTIDKDRGWVNRINVQGIAFYADHIAVVDHGTWVEIFNWDPQDQSGDVWTLYEQEGQAEHHMDSGAVLLCEGPIQHRVAYGWEETENWTSGGRVRFRPFRDYPIVDESLVRYGIWQPQGLFDATKSKQGRPLKAWQRTTI